jgi:hypothetical protein
MTREQFLSWPNLIVVVIGFVGLVWFITWGQGSYGDKFAISLIIVCVIGAWLYDHSTSRAAERDKSSHQCPYKQTTYRKKD